MKEEANWPIVNKLCQWADIPFDPIEWGKMFETNREKTFDLYTKVYRQGVVETPDWAQYNKKYLSLQRRNELEDEFPELKEEKLNRLRDKWGANYCEEQLGYLESLCKGLMNSQNINGALQEDQALKLCKISLLLDERIRNGEDFDKLIGSYDKLTKTADFTPKNVKNANDFDSVGEIFSFLEKKGWVNKFYDGETRDEVDNTMKNVQAYVRKLYVNESGIGEEVERKIEQLKVAESLEKESFDYHDDDRENDDYDKEAYDIIEEFDPEI